MMTTIASNNTLAAPAETVPAWPRELRRDLDRLGQMEWRMRAATGDRCPTLAADAGLTFDDRRAYSKDSWPLLAQPLQLGPGPVIAAVADGGPAAQAGIRAGDTVTAIAGKPVEAIVANGSNESLAADSLADFVAGQTPETPFVMSLRRGERTFDVNVTPARHCAARFILSVDNTVEAHSDGRNIAVSTGSMQFVASDDELAWLTGHELGHVVLRHGKPHNLTERRAMEDAADLVGTQLIRCAGYAPDKAAMFWDRYGKGDVLGFLRSPTHRSPRARAIRIREAPPAIIARPLPLP